MWFVSVAAAQCPPTPPLPTVVAESVDVFVVTADKERDQPPFVVLEATVVAVHAGCATPGDVVELLFPEVGRPAWSIGEDYVVSTSEAAGQSRTWSCGLFVPPALLTAAELAYLGSRPLECGGAVTCQDGALPASCPDLCADVSCPDATCAVNPCAACALEVYGSDGLARSDADSDGVCDESDACPGSDDRADGDGDGVCDAADLCLAGDDAQDDDDDGVPDACDEDEGASHSGAEPPPTTGGPPVIGGGGGGCRGCAGAPASLPFAIPATVIGALSAVQRRRRSRTRPTTASSD